MLAEQSLREGRLDDALAQLQEQVRKDPARPEYRVFLFQLLSVLGQWDRALTQLNVAGELDAGALAMVQTYREALQCEKLRAAIFEGDRTPLVFGEPQSWVALLLEALRLVATQRCVDSQTVRAEAFDAAPSTPGSIDGQSFEWIADADPRLGPVLEAIINGRYYWVPFNRIRRIELEEPVDLRDVVWTPAQFTWANGGEAVGFIPSRYSGSQDHDDPQIRLARKTEWVDQGGGLFLGSGQRMLATNDAEYPLMDVRSIEFASQEDDEKASEAG